MNVEKKTFAAWAGQFGIDNDKAASLAEAAEVKLIDEFTEKQFRKIVPLTTEDYLKKTSSIKAADRGAFCEQFGFKLDDEMDAETFAEAVTEFKQSQQPPAPPPSPTPPAPQQKEGDGSRKWLLAGTIKYQGAYHQPGELLELDLDEAELAALAKRGVIVDPNAKTD